MRNLCVSGVSCILNYGHVIGLMSFEATHFSVTITKVNIILSAKLPILYSLNATLNNQGPLDFFCGTMDSFRLFHRVSTSSDGLFGLL